MGLPLDGIGEQVRRLAQYLPSESTEEADWAREIRGLEQHRDPVVFEGLAIVRDARGLAGLADVATIVREARPGALALRELGFDQVRPGAAARAARLPAGEGPQQCHQTRGHATAGLLVQRAEIGHSLKAARFLGHTLPMPRPVGTSSSSAVCHPHVRHWGHHAIPGTQAGD